MSKFIKQIRLYPAITTGVVQLALALAVRLSVDVGPEVEAAVWTLAIALGAGYVTKNARSVEGILDAVESGKPLDLRTKRDLSDVGIDDE